MNGSALEDWKAFALAPGDCQAFGLALGDWQVFGLIVGDWQLFPMAVCDWQVVGLAVGGCVPGSGRDGLSVLAGTGLRSSWAGSGSSLSVGRGIGLCACCAANDCGRELLSPIKGVN